MFSVASTLLTMFELYWAVPLEFSVRTWIPVNGGEESMEGPRDSAVKTARRLVGRCAH